MSYLALEGIMHGAIEQGGLKRIGLLKGSQGPTASFELLVLPVHVPTSGFDLCVRLQGVQAH